MTRKNYTASDIAFIIKSMANNRGVKGENKAVARSLKRTESGIIQKKQYIQRVIWGEIQDALVETELRKQGYVLDPMRDPDIDRVPKKFSITGLIRFLLGLKPKEEHGADN